MITTKSLGSYGTVREYDSEATVSVAEPTGTGLPEEWRGKLLSWRHMDAPVVAEIHNVDLLGPGMVGVKDGDVILDTTYFGRYDLLDRNRPYLEWAAQASHEKAVKIDRPVVSLVSCWGWNYFHWLIDTLPKLAAVDRPLVLIAANSPAFIVDSLNGYDLMYAEWSHYKAETLIVPSTRRKDSYLHPSVPLFLRDYFAPGLMLLPEVISGGPWNNGRYYITRRNAISRRVVNEEELINRLDRLGFAVVEMEKLTIQQQASMMTGASAIVSPHGAGLANIVFCHTAKVVELIAPQYTNPCCWMVGAASGLDYGFVVGEPTGIEDMRIDVDKVEEVLSVL